MVGLSLPQFWGITGDKGVVHLIINIEYTVIATDPGSLIRNMPHSIRLVFYETNDRYHQ